MSLTLRLRPPAPDTRQPTDRPMRARRLQRTPLTPSSGDTTYPVPSIEVTAQEHDMNAPPNIVPATAHSDSDVLHWLTSDTRDERFIDNIFAELCVRLQRAGIPVKRASLHILIHHPQWLGARFMWTDEMRAKGLTDYVAWPLYHTLGKRHFVTFATDRPGGFHDAQLAGLFQLLPIL